MIKSCDIGIGRRLVLAAAVAAPLAEAAAREFPERTLRLIVPYPPGGGTDIAARLLAERLRATLAQPVVIENRPGASESIGTEAVVRAASDGYTIGLITNAVCIHPSMNMRLPYNAQRDLLPISTVVRIPHVLVVHPSVQATTLAELLSLVRAQPNRFSYASLGPASPHAVAMEWLKQLTGTQILQVPYSGVAPAVTAVANGEVQMTLSGITAAVPQIEAGRLRPIAVSPAAGIASYPDWPPIARDVPGFDMASWYGVVAPAGVDRAIVAGLRDAIAAALATPEVRQAIAALGGEIAPSTPEEFQALIRRETELWSQVIGASGARVE